MSTHEIMAEGLGMLVAIVDHYSSLFRVVRRWRGGRWEKWWIGPPVASSIWFKMRDGEEPPAMALMLDAVEDYRPVLPELPGAGPYRTVPSIGNSQRGETR